MPTLTPIRRTFLIVAALLLATVIIYWPVAWHQYLSVDDHAYVSDNKIVQAGLTWNGLVWAFNGAHVSNYHPLTWLSHMLDCQLFGPGPRAGHLVNLALHTINSILLFFVLRWMTGREWCSAFVAAVFALHPQHVESVAWVSERKDVLSGLFWILTLAAWAWYVDGPRWWKYALALLAFALGLLSKPMVVTLPCVLLLLDFWPLRRMSFFGEATSGYRRSIGFLIVEKLPFFALALGGCITTVLAQSDGGAVVTMEQIPLGWRIGNTIVAYVAYARKFLWPSDLAIFYPLLRPQPMLTILAALALLALVTALVLIKGRSKPYLPVGWLWFLGTLVPVIGLIQVGNQSMADRYMYLPMIGLAVMIAWWAADLVRNQRHMTAACGFAAIGLLSLSIVTAHDVRAWRDSETVFTRALERTEPNIFAYHNLAAAKFINGEIDQAVTLFAECASLQPANPHIRRAYGVALRAAKRYDEAYQQLKLAIELNPREGRAWTEMGNYHLARENWAMAARDLKKAVSFRPDDFETRVNLAIACRLSGDLRGAEREFRASLEINPRSARTWCGYGALLLELNRPADAIEPLRRAAGIDPGSAEAQYRLGLALVRTGRADQALTPLMTALSLDPRSSVIMTQLAWVLATHPDEKLRRGEDALFFATAASELATSPESLDALAAALAEQKHFDRALQTAQRAAKLARDSGKEPLAQQIDQRIERYRSHSAVRDATLVGTDTGDALP